MLIFNDWKLKLWSLRLYLVNAKCRSFKVLKFNNLEDLTDWYKNYLKFKIKKKHILITISLLELETAVPSIICSKLLRHCTVLSFSIHLWAALDWVRFNILKYHHFIALTKIQSENSKIMNNHRIITYHYVQCLTYV